MLFGGSEYNLRYVVEHELDRIGFASRRTADGERLEANRMHRQIIAR